MSAQFDLADMFEIVAKEVPDRIALQADDLELTYAQLKDAERENVRAVLRHTGWKVAGPGGAAEFLGVHPATLTSRLARLGLSRPR